MNKVYVIGGIRTPIGKINGAFKNILPEKLAAKVLNDLISLYNLSPLDIEQVVLGNVVGTGGNIARLATLEADWDFSIPAMTVDTQCGSGLNSINIAVSFILSGQMDLIIAGGMESTSLAPQRKFNKNDPRFINEDTYYEQAPFSPPSRGNPIVGLGAEALAEKFLIFRNDMDELAFASHRKAADAQKKGYLENIITPIDVDGNIVKKDECIRANMSLDLLKRMPPTFLKKGRITAGNTCLKHDGAAALLLASQKAIEKYNLVPQATIENYTNAGCDPNYFPLGPVCAIRKLLEKKCLSIEDIDLIEINEAFAVKILACCKELNLPLEKVNSLGGALAYGHPYGASGAIIMLHLLKSLEVFNKTYGIASIGSVGGLGTATLLRRC